MLVRFADLSSYRQETVRGIAQQSLACSRNHPDWVVHRHDPQVGPRPVVYIGRPGPWGNPFPLFGYTSSAAREECILDFISNLLYGTQRPLLTQLPELEGVTLQCWCRHSGHWKTEQLCHGDVLLYLAMTHTFF